ncbi:hypothetical protein ACI7BZ_00585 [Xanthobacter sp. AM11]|uniref:hypothetical protein n=1 Tax=Xanthobacter sp. AM11 TaxID=3380643 RepID=UPI0039BF9B92
MTPPEVSRITVLPTIGRKYLWLQGLLAIDGIVSRCHQPDTGRRVGDAPPPDGARFRLFLAGY